MDTFGLLRQHTVAEVAAQTIYASGQIGKAALAKPVLGAMGSVPRHEFVPVELQPYAYANTPLPIGFDKTISQPFIVALMTDLLDLNAAEAVLEIGTGLGYQAAILAELAHKVSSVEIIEELGRQAEQRLRRLGYTNIEFKIGNGHYGWPEYAPFDKVIVTAAPDLIPPQLIQQLKPEGTMVIPAGLPGEQQLMLVTKTATIGRTRTRHEARLKRPATTAEVTVPPSGRACVRSLVRPHIPLRLAFVCSPT